MPNLDPWINQNNSNRNEEYTVTKTINKFENHLLSIRDEHQERLRPNLHHHTYNERHEKIIELIEWTLEKYKETVTNIQDNQHLIQYGFHFLFLINIQSFPFPLYC
jgi:uncharacterized NAD(P)/FAD-binding protein YdhS